MGTDHLCGNTHFLSGLADCQPAGESLRTTDSMDDIRVRPKHLDLPLVVCCSVGHRAPHQWFQVGHGPNRKVKGVRWWESSGVRAQNQHQTSIHLNLQTDTQTVALCLWETLKSSLPHAGLTWCTRCLLTLTVVQQVNITSVGCTETAQHDTGHYLNATDLLWALNRDPGRDRASDNIIYESPSCLLKQRKSSLSRSAGKWIEGGGGTHRSQTISHCWCAGTSAPSRRRDGGGAQWEV